MLRVYVMLKSQYLKTAMEYKFNFWMMFVAGILMRTLMMGVAFVLFRSMPIIAGFTEGEVYFIMALMSLSDGISTLLFDGTWHIPALVHDGQFDVMLVRPISPLYQVMSYEIGLQGTGIVAVGVISLVLSIKFTIFTGLWIVPMCLLFIVTSTLLRLSLYIIANSSVFFMDTGGQISIPYMTYSFGEYAKYPVSIYPLWLQGIMFSIIPFAFIGYVPLLIMRGTHSGWLTLLLIAVSIGYFVLARTVFYLGIDRYESMGM